MQAEYLKRRFEIKDDLHRLISGIELSRSLKTEEKEVKDGVFAQPDGTPSIDLYNYFLS